MELTRITRRKLLAGIAGGGTASVGGLTLSTSRSPTFTETIEIRRDSIEGLMLDWRETYNGATVSNATDGTASRSPGGPAITLGNVLPGDSGSLSARLRLDPGTDRVGEEIAIEPRLSLELSGELTSPGLHEFIEAEVWYDTGLLGIDRFGARNAERDFGEGLVHPDSEGSLADVATALNNGIPLNASPTGPGWRCLEDGDDVTITFGWWFSPEQPNINAVQGDSVAFDLQFDGERC